MTNDAGLLVFAGVGLAAWFWFGDPPATVAGWFWRETPAPWERVDAFYYPNRGDLSRVELAHNLDGLEGCRDWVLAAAARGGDPALRRGDYECGVGEPKQMGFMSVYRLTVR